MSDVPPWDVLRSFAAVMRDGSLSAAARQLATAQATVRRHVETLEHSWGTALFTRAPNGLTPTAAARDALPHVVAMEMQVAAMTRAVSGANAATGTVRITASEIIAAEVLPPILTQLRRDWPAIEIEVSAVNTVEDLLRRDADIAIRMARPNQDALVARHIGSVTVGLFARPTCFDAAVLPANVADLSDHALIGGDRDSSMRDALVAFGIANPRFALRSDSDMVQLAAVRAGLGIGACQLPIAARDPLLIRVLPEHGIALDLWLAMHEDLRTVLRVRTVYDAVAKGLGIYLAGTRPPLVPEGDAQHMV